MAHGREAKKIGIYKKAQKTYFMKNKRHTACVCIKDISGSSVLSFAMMLHDDDVVGWVCVCVDPFPLPSIDPQLILIGKDRPKVLINFTPRRVGCA